MARPINNLVGKKFGKLTVVAFDKVRNGKANWFVECECGTKKSIMVKPTVKSCGCEGGIKIHGLWKHPLYLTWQNMITRCYNPKSPDWEDYGGRGITVCDRWLKVENFIEDIVERPKGCQIDRIKNDLGYSKDNCQWSTKVQNARNKRNNTLVIFEGREMSLPEASELSGVSYHTLRQRVRIGKNPDIFRK